jgi:hypothetical protein
LPAALWFDLLRTQTLLSLSRQPESFRQQIEARASDSWIVVDEVQRLPGLLQEVHALIGEHGSKYRFALSGSSARKLKHCFTTWSWVFRRRPSSALVAGGNEDIALVHIEGLSDEHQIGTIDLFQVPDYFTWSPITSSSADDAFTPVCTPPRTRSRRPVRSSSPRGQPRR